MEYLKQINNIGLPQVKKLEEIFSELFFLNFFM